MKKIVFTSIITILFLGLSSFINNPTKSFIGTYGVSESNPNKIELTIMANQSFNYKDLTNSNKPITVSGNWELKNNTVILKDYESKYSFHKKWKIVRNGMAAKSRKGLCFYTLAKL